VITVNWVETHLVAALCTWSVGFLMGVVVRQWAVGAIRRAWGEHVELQRRQVLEQERIADLVNPLTPGGLGDIDLPLKKEG
jgi:hypothetical protein